MYSVHVHVLYTCTVYICASNIPTFCMYIVYMYMYMCTVYVVVIVVRSMKWPLTQPEKDMNS